MAQYVKPRFLYIHATGYRNINSNSLFLFLLGHFVQGNISHLSSKKLWMRLNRGDESSSLDEIFHPRQYLTERSLSSSIVPSYSLKVSSLFQRNRISRFSEAGDRVSSEKKWRGEEGIRIKGWCMDGELLRASTEIYEKNFNFHLRKLVGTITPGW